MPGIRLSSMAARRGLTAGLAWKSRHLSASVASGAFKGIGKVRDEKWLTKNPINYA